MTETKTRLAFDNQKLLGFGVVVMTTPSYARVSSEKGELTCLRCFQHFNKYTAFITILGYCVAELFRFKVTYIGRIKGNRTLDPATQCFLKHLDRLDFSSDLPEENFLHNDHGTLRVLL